MGTATIFNCMEKQLEWVVLSTCFAARSTKDNWYWDYFWKVQYTPTCSKLFHSHFERYKVEVKYLFSFLNVPKKC